MEKQDYEKKSTAAEHLAEMFDALGSALSQIFNDPGLKEKARDLGRAAKESAETLGERFKDEEVKAKFNDAGKAAQAFGKNISELFTDIKSPPSGAEKGENL